MNTLSYILVAIQINIPSVITRKTYPGCIKSFVGFPLTNDNKDGLIYIACVARNLSKGKIEPWNSIKNLKEELLQHKIEETIKKHIINRSDIQDKIHEKREHLKTDDKQHLLLESNVLLWINYLPPLHGVTIKKLEPITDIFKDKLHRNMITGLYQQQEQIEIIKSKIIAFSLLIQEKIQKIVTKQNPLIKNKGGVPFLQNACCDSESIKFLKYFIDKDNSIQATNDTVKEYVDMLDGIKKLATPAIFYHPVDTKFHYPKIVEGFTKDTIYGAFYYFCKNRQLLFSEKLREICTKVSFDEGDDIVAKLEDESVLLDDEMFQRLMNIINNENIVTMPANISRHGYVTSLRNILKELVIKPDTFIPERFISYIYDDDGILDTFDISQYQEADVARGFRNYLAKENTAKYNRIIDFVKHNSPKISKKNIAAFEDTLQNITKFKTNNGNQIIHNEDQTLLKMRQFIQNTLHMIGNIVPNIILNEVSILNINIPKHWNLSQRHTTDIKEINDRYYIRLKQFYGRPELTTVLKHIQSALAAIVNLANNTPFFAYEYLHGVKLQEPKHSIFDRDLVELLYNYYFLTALDIHILIIDDEEGFIKPDVVEEKKSPAKKSPEKKSPESSDAPPRVEISKDFHDVKLIKNSMAEYLKELLELVSNNKEVINFDKDSIVQKIGKAKEREKNKITEDLKNLTIEEREIENILKNQKLDKWGKGLQKGLVSYVQDTYDQERDELEKQTLKDIALANNTDANDRNIDIYSFEYEQKALDEQEIADEVDDIQHFQNPEGDNDEDEYGEQSVDSEYGDYGYDD